MFNLKTQVMEQRTLKLLRIQLKLVALVCVAAMVVFLCVAFSPAKRMVEPSCKKAACLKEKEQRDDLRESFLIGKLLSYSTFETE